MDATRRWILGTAPILMTAGCLGGEGPEAETYGNWFRNSNNYQGTQDLTDASQVTIGVGVGGGRAYGPAAAQITVGTTVQWEWTGKGGQHNVLDEDRVFESVLTAEAGHTFTTVIDQPGVYRYYCTPHQPTGMVGALQVVE